MWLSEWLSESAQKHCGDFAGIVLLMRNRHDSRPQPMLRAKREPRTHAGSAHSGVFVVDRRQWGLRWPRQHVARRRESRPVAWAIPRSFGFVPVNNAAQVATD